MSDELVTDPAIVALEPDKTRLQAFATNLIIKSAEGYMKAADMLKSIKTALSTIEAARVRITKPLNDALRETNKQAKAAAEPFERDEQAIKGSMLIYANEQERLRQEEQRRHDAEAARERARLQAIADAAAQKAREDAAEKRRLADEAEQAGRMEEANKLTAQAERAEERGAQKQERFESRASSTVAPVAAQAAPTVSGISMPKVWDFAITAKELIPREYLMVDEVKIRKIVLALKGDTNIPGVRVFQKNRISAGRG